MTSKGALTCARPEEVPLNIQTTASLPQLGRGIDPVFVYYFLVFLQMLDWRIGSRFSSQPHPHQLLLIRLSDNDDNRKLDILIATRYPLTEKEVAFWRSIRQQFYLKDNVTYLQGGTVGPSPRPVTEYVISLLRELESDPLNNGSGSLLAPLVEESRRKLGQFVGAKPEQIALVVNTTMGMNIPACGLPLQSGQEILMSDQEYGAIKAIWEYVAAEKGLEIRTIPLPTPPEHPTQVVEAFASGISRRTQVVVFSHVYCTSGLVAPVKELCQLAHDYNAFAVVDGAHAVGMVPVDIANLGCDFYLSSCHKWLLAPKGIGMAYLAESFLDLRPATLGFGLNQGHPHRFDVAGTRDSTHFAGLGKAINFQQEIGWEDRIRPYCLSLAARLKDQVLDRIPTAKLMVPTDTEQSGFLTTFTIPGINHGKAAGYLWQDHQIQTVSVDAGGTSVFRISTHFYNSHSDIDRFISALAETVDTRSDVKI